MDVIHFTESDVIVASAIDTVTLSGLGNRNLTDNALSYGTTSIDLQEAGAYHIQFGSGFDNNGNIKSLNDLVTDASDSGDTVNSDWNHTYNYDQNSGYFVYRSN